MVKQVGDTFMVEELDENGNLIEVEYQVVEVQENATISQKVLD
ncbi:hypothetical protein LC087_19490 (plasmid) [Bacillus carboniphilus]|uniref:DUF2187 domain-containing protein n=1 Tax=Bacillus carboniphilus TaxID=86663 RepID=A0ABY9JYQ2_9BACI|nr:hypothetical protein [Bacillus carboniphilus]WLR44485.1 hypothetical protein LC087_19490 [Bacillus carboniphilus]